MPQETGTQKPYISLSITLSNNFLTFSNRLLVQNLSIKYRCRIIKMKHKMKYSKLSLAKEAINHKGFVKKIPDIFRMVRMWRKGEYPMRSIDIILPLLGVLYIISPIDILPEVAVPVIGVLDDLAVLSLTIPKLIKEVDKFLLWEAERKYNTDSTKVINAEIIK